MVHPEELQVRVDESAEFQCRATGTPSPPVTWKRERQVRGLIRHQGDIL